MHSRTAPGERSVRLHRAISDTPVHGVGSRLGGGLHGQNGGFGFVSLV